MSAWSIDNQSYNDWNAQDTLGWVQEPVTMNYDEESETLIMIYRGDTTTLKMVDKNEEVLYISKADYIYLPESGIHRIEKTFPEDTYFFNFLQFREGGCSYVNSEEFHICKSCHETNGRIDIEELTEDLPPDDYYQRSYIVEGNRIIINFLSLESINITLTWEWDGSTFKLEKA